MPRYQAPKNVTAIHTSAGSHYIADKHGVIVVPDDAPTGDHVSLCSAGWAPIEAKASTASSSELGELRAQYQAVFGKKPAPNLKADALAAKIAEHKAAAEPPAGDA
jgi:hypothetical protein